jgi:hypothetical protein
MIDEIQPSIMVRPILQMSRINASIEQTINLEFLKWIGSRLGRQYPKAGLLKVLRPIVPLVRA